MIGYVRLSIQEAALALTLLEELEHLYTEQLWDEDHPLGEENKRLASKLRIDIFRKLERAKSRSSGRRSDFGRLLREMTQIGKDIDRLIEETKDLELSPDTDPPEIDE